MARTLKYVERCTGANHNGDAWIGYAEISRTGRTVYFNGKAFVRAPSSVMGNHLDVDNYDEYWISGVKKTGTNRHWAGSGRIQIESTAVSEYLRLAGLSKIDPSKFEVIDPLPKADPEDFREYFNRSWADAEPDDAV